MGTGLGKVTSCQPVAVSLVKVAEASNVPVTVQRLPDVRAGVAGALVEADAADAHRRCRTGT